MSHVFEEQKNEKKRVVGVVRWGFVSDPSGFWSGFVPYVEPLDEVKSLKRIVLLNSPLVFPGFMTYAIRIDLDTAREIVKKAESVESYIGHQATAELLESLLGVRVPVNRAMYEPQRRDYALVFRLKKRLEKPEDIKNITPDDIEVLSIAYEYLEPKYG